MKRTPSRYFWVYQKGQSARIYRPGFINKNDHVISWNKNLVPQISWLDKKNSDFSTDISRGDNWFVKYTQINRQLILLNDILFKKYLGCKFQLHKLYLKSRFKKDSLLILIYSESLWYNWDPWWVRR